MNISLSHPASTERDEDNQTTRALFFFLMPTLTYWKGGKKRQNIQFKIQKKLSTFKILGVFNDAESYCVLVGLRAMFPSW